MLSQTLTAFHDAVSLLLRGQVERRNVLEGLDLVLLAADETVDDGYVSFFSRWFCDLLHRTDMAESSWKRTLLLLLLESPDLGLILPILSLMKKPFVMLVSHLLVSSSIVFFYHDADVQSRVSRIDCSSELDSCRYRYRYRCIRTRYGKRQDA